MKTLEPTLKERAGRMYRRLLVLQRVFQPSRDGDVEWPQRKFRKRFAQTADFDGWCIHDLGRE